MVITMKMTPLYDEILQLPQYEVLKEDFTRKDKEFPDYNATPVTGIITSPIDSGRPYNPLPFTEQNSPHYARHIIHVNEETSNAAPVEERAIIRPKDTYRTINEEHESFHADSESGMDTNTGMLNQHPPIQPLSAEPAYLPPENEHSPQKSQGDSIMDDLESLARGNAIQPNRNKNSINRRRKRRR
jgi:hypothetical protein